jgi:hypothetical protein
VVPTRGADRQNRCRQGLISILGSDRDSALPDRLDEGAVVAEVLVGVFDRELADVNGLRESSSIEFAYVQPV